MASREGLYLVGQLVTAIVVPDRANPKTGEVYKGGPALQVTYKRPSGLLALETLFVKDLATYSTKKAGEPISVPVRAAVAAGGLRLYADEQ